MGPKTTRLVEVLERVVALMTDPKDASWRKWLERDLTLIRSGEIYGVKHLERAFGGGKTNVAGTILERSRSPEITQLIQEAATLAAEIHKAGTTI